MTVVMNELEYASFLRKLTDTPGTKSLLKLRRGMEQTYYLHHHARGVRLRGKYRIR
jgi:hypothetical protein